MPNQPKSSNSGNSPSTPGKSSSPAPSFNLSDASNGTNRQRHITLGMPISTTVPPTSETVSPPLRNNTADPYEAIPDAHARDLPRSQGVLPSQSGSRVLSALSTFSEASIPSQRNIPSVPTPSSFNASLAMPAAAEGTSRSVNSQSISLLDRAVSNLGSSQRSSSITIAMPQQHMGGANTSPSPSPPLSTAIFNNEPPTSRSAILPLEMPVPSGRPDDDQNKAAISTHSIRPTLVCAQPSNSQQSLVHIGTLSSNPSMSIPISDSVSITLPSTPSIPRLAPSLKMMPSTTSLSTQNEPRTMGTDLGSQMTSASAKANQFREAAAAFSLKHTRKVSTLVDDAHKKVVESNAFNNTAEGAERIMEQESVDRFTTCMTDMLVRYMNCQHLFMHPRRFTNRRWANAAHEQRDSGQQLHPLQWKKLYLRETSRYKYHRLQQYSNLTRHFNISVALSQDMNARGSQAFYDIVCDRPSREIEFAPPDLTRLNRLTTVPQSAKYLYDTLSRRVNDEVAKVSRDCYVRGFSRPIKADDDNDWQLFRDQLKELDPSVHQDFGYSESDICPIAISYKAKEAKITRRMVIREVNGTPIEGEGILAEEEIEITDDFVLDFRWSQVIRSCQEIARIQGKQFVRMWIDRLVMWNKDKDERQSIYKKVAWEDFGLFAYGVCPVVRLYDRKDIDYGTDFWRKMEAVMGVAGCGLFVDDYILRTYDQSLFYDPSIYTRLRRGISCLGGNGVYVRAVSLALATGLLTDGITTRGVNENPKTKTAISGWKAWALRTIAQNAYSSDQPPILCQQDAFLIGLEEFRTIAFWESFVSSCTELEGNSYLDMSWQRSEEWRSSPKWDGILEWVGMLPDSCEISEKEKIQKFLNANSSISAWTATSGHVAAIIDLYEDPIRKYKTEDFKKLKRSLVVELAPFSSSGNGQVTSVAEATGLWGPKVLPWWLFHVPDPDIDQQVRLNEYDRLVYVYEWMEVALCFPVHRRLFLIVIFLFAQWLIFPTFVFPYGRSTAFLLIPAVQTCAALIYFVTIECTHWPWAGDSIGESLFDNLLMHSLYNAGIKMKQYRRLSNVDYKELNWV